MITILLGHTLLNAKSNVRCDTEYSSSKSAVSTEFGEAADITKTKISVWGDLEKL